MTEPQEPTPQAIEAALGPRGDLSRCLATALHVARRAPPGGHEIVTAITDAIEALRDVRARVGAVGDAQAPGLRDLLREAMDLLNEAATDLETWARPNSPMDAKARVYATFPKLLRKVGLVRSKVAKLPAARGHDGDPPKSRSQLKRIAAQKGEPMPTFEDVPPVPASPHHPLRLKVHDLLQNYLGNDVFDAPWCAELFALFDAHTPQAG